MTSWQLRVLAGRDEITGKKNYVSKTFRGGGREAERELARLTGQVCALRWRNIDIEGRSLHIAGALVRINRTVIEKDTKTHAERRVVLDEGTFGFTILPTSA